MLIISHRGAKGLAPENTKPGFEAALKSNADYIEFDVNTTNDGVLVVNHDPYPDLDYEQLKKTFPDLLTFREVCDILDNKKPYFIDVKPTYEIDLVVKEISEAKLPENTIIASFNYSILKAFKKAGVKADLLVLHSWSSVIATRRARKLGTHYIAIGHHNLWSGVIRALTKRGYKLIPFTLNNRKKIERWKKYGIYGVVTDFPDIMND